MAIDDACRCWRCGTKIISGWLPGFDAPQHRFNLLSPETKGVPGWTGRLYQVFRIRVIYRLTENAKRLRYNFHSRITRRLLLLDIIVTDERRTCSS